MISLAGLYVSIQKKKTMENTMLHRYLIFTFFLCWDNRQRTCTNNVHLLIYVCMYVCMYGHHI